MSETEAMLQLLLRALGETLAMVFAAGLLGMVGGVPLGTALYVTGPGRFLARPWVNRILGLFVNAGRSVPFIILLVAVVPFTRWVVGSSIGVAAAIVPLTLGAVPFAARLVEGALLEVPPAQIEAAYALGAGNRQVICRVLLPEALPGILHSATVLLVALVNYSAMAGAVGAGGLGDVGIRYGLYRYNGGVMLVVILLIILLVQGIQWVGDRLASGADRRF
ncbi:MAG: ABC transporter permease [Puniceicoccales bacterium]|jgi:D-methionine transport system permease protein|nr:ABC transporter permease [Puniceicoccales bacterium]